MEGDRYHVRMRTCMCQEALAWHPAIHQPRTTSPDLQSVIYNLNHHWPHSFIFAGRLSRDAIYLCVSDHSLLKLGERDTHISS